MMNEKKPEVLTKAQARGEIIHRGVERQMAEPKRDDKGRRFVTVDTGGLDDAFYGALVTWLHVPSGGYGYTMPIDAKVIGTARQYVRIEVKTAAGRTVRRNVKAENLRWRQ